MSCQGSPTLTQYDIAYSTSYQERVIVTTEYVTVTIPARLRARQDPASSTPTTSDQTFSVNDVTPVARTITVTEAVVATNTVPTLTLFAPCTTTTSDGSESGNNTTTTTTRTSSGDSGGSITPSRAAQADSVNDGKATTTSNGITIILTEMVTTINGVETIFATPIQTLLNTSDSILSDSQKNGVIAGAAVGGVCVLVALLGAIFFLRRARKARKRMLAEKNKRPTRHLLEDEADYPPAQMTQWDAYSATGSTMSAPRLLRARGSQTGSVFHEDVWPPPNEVMQDPLLTSQDLGSSISLAVGLPYDAPSELQASPDAASPSEMMGSLGRMHRSSAYDSIRSTDSMDYNRTHSRAESSAPLLDDAGRAISPSSPSTRSTTMVSPSSARGRDSRRSNLRVSYTADEMGGLSSGGFMNRAAHYRSGTSNSVYSTSSMSPQNDRVSPLVALNADPRASELGASPPRNDIGSPQELRLVGSRTQLSSSNPPRDELPPQYHTIPGNT